MGNDRKRTIYCRKKQFHASVRLLKMNFVTTMTSWVILIYSIGFWSVVSFLSVFVVRVGMVDIVIVTFVILVISSSEFDDTSRYTRFALNQQIHHYVLSLSFLINLFSEGFFSCSCLLFCSFQFYIFYWCSVSYSKQHLLSILFETCINNWKALSFFKKFFSIACCYAEKLNQKPFGGNSWWKYSVNI